MWGSVHKLKVTSKQVFLYFTPDAHQVQKLVHNRVPVRIVP